MESKKKISLVIPIHNESGNLAQLYQQLQMTLSKLTHYEFEILFVNDGSHDNSLHMLQTLRQYDPRVHWISLSRNFGKEIALSAGLDFAEGDAVILMDADLQHPPDLIPSFLEAWESGVQVVYAQIQKRAHETPLKQYLTSFFYRLMGKISDISIPPHAGDFRLLDRRAVDSLKLLPEHHRYMKGLYAWIGFSQKAIPYIPHQRYSGKTNWSYHKLFGFAMEGITSFSTAPLRLATYLGFFSAGMAFLYAMYIVCKTLVFGDPVKGYPTLIVIILLLGGIQLITLGILGEYVGRVFNEAKNRPLYLVQAGSKGKP